MPREQLIWKSKTKLEMKLTQKKEGYKRLK
jgi:hypothetical protein